MLLLTLATVCAALLLAVGILLHRNRCLALRLRDAEPVVLRFPEQRHGRLRVWRDRA